MGINIWYIASSLEQVYKNIYMKHLPFFLFALLIIFTGSCSEDNEGKNYKDNIIGTWIFTSFSPKEIETNIQKAKKAIEKDIREERFDNEDIGLSKVVFKKENTYKILPADGGEESGTYFISGDILTIVTKDVDDICDTATFQIDYLSKNRLSLDSDLTEEYKEKIKYILSDEEAKNVIISKVILYSKVTGLQKSEKKYLFLRYENQPAINRYKNLGTLPASCFGSAFLCEGYLYSDVG